MYVQITFNERQRERIVSAHYNKSSTSEDENVHMDLSTQPKGKQSQQASTTVRKRPQHAQEEIDTSKAMVVYYRIKFQGSRVG